MTATEVDFYRDKGVLPAFVAAWDCAVQALPALGPVERISVPAAAKVYRRLNDPGYSGPWSNDVVPYMVEPGEMMTSRQFGGVIFAGPSRTAKTAMLIENTVAHRIRCQPRNMMVVHMTQFTARKFSVEKLDRMINASPELKDRLMIDNTYDKTFSGGARLSIGWPTISQLSGADIPDVLLTDYDRMPEDLDDEGEVFHLARKRTQTYGSLGNCSAESSPGRPVLNPDFEFKTPHEPPPTTGILSLYGMGTRGRLFWPCAQCGSLFEARFEYLDFPKSADPAEAGQAAKMVGPCCGYPHEPALKRELNAASLWLHEGRNASSWQQHENLSVEQMLDANMLSPIGGDVRRASLASYWMQGPAAAFQSWAQLVERYLSAEAHFKKTGDENQIKVTVNVDQGLPHTPRALESSTLLVESFLRKHGIACADRMVPEWVRFLTVQVDVQGTYFACQVDAWGEDLRRLLVDRFDIFIPAENADRKLDPARYDKDWNQLFSLLERAYRVEGCDYEIVPSALCVDSGGRPGVTPRAYAFWRRARKRGLMKRVNLVKGNHVKTGQPEDQRRAVKAYPERSTENGKKKSLDVPVIWVGTDALKDEVAAALTMEENVGPVYRVRTGVDESVYSELTSERREAKGWSLKPGSTRNEAFDLAVYGKALVLIRGGEKIDWHNPVDWAAPLDQNCYARKVSKSKGAVAQAASNAVQKPLRQSSKFLGNRSNFMGR